MRKIFRLALSVLIPVLFLSACGSGTAAPSGGAAASNTAAAQTVFAAQTAAVLPATALPSLTPVPQISPTLTVAITPTARATIPVVPVTSLCDDSAFVSDVTIPDGTVIAPGEGFTKTWGLRNTGTCDWSTAYALASLSGPAMDGSRTRLSASVKAGDSVNISVGMYAPLTAGTYIGYWRLQNAVGTFFGEAVYVKIVVSGGTVTVTTTPTATGTGPTLTATPTPIATYTSTATPTYTTVPDTPTETPTDPPAS